MEEVDIKPSKALNFHIILEQGPTYAPCDYVDIHATLEVSSGSQSPRRLVPGKGEGERMGPKLYAIMS